jgi:hypothetical protein
MQVHEGSLHQVMHDVHDARFANPYFFCVYNLIPEVIQSDHVTATDKVGFVFDKQAERRMVRDGFDEFVNGLPERLQSRLWGDPRFENDEEFPPLQAADLLAWWFRRWSVDANLGQPLWKPPWRFPEMQLPMFAKKYGRAEIERYRRFMLDTPAGMATLNPDGSVTIGKPLYGPTMTFYGDEQKGSASVLRYYPKKKSGE